MGSGESGVVSPSIINDNKDENKMVDSCVAETKKPGKFNIDNASDGSSVIRPVGDISSDIDMANSNIILPPGETQSFSTDNNQTCVPPGVTDHLGIQHSITSNNTGSNRGIINIRCRCVIGCMPGHGCLMPVRRSVIRYAHRHLFEMIEDIYEKKCRLQHELVRTRERQQLISRLLHFENSITELVDEGIFVLSDWDREICAELDRLEANMCGLSRGLKEREKVFSVFENLLRFPSDKFILTPGGPIVAYDGVLTVFFDYVEPFICRLCHALD